MTRARCTLVLAAWLVACSSTPLDRGAEQASPETAATTTVAARGSAAPTEAFASDLRVSTLTTAILRRSPEGEVEETEILDNAAYDAAAKTALPAISRCSIGKDEIAVLLAVSAEGEVRSVEEVKNADACVSAAIQKTAFPKHPKERPSSSPSTEATPAPSHSRLDLALRDPTTHARAGC
jgi:hypothetical protein